MIYLTLAYEFFKIGLFAIGGGMATLPFLMNLTTKYDWYTASELANMIAISESTPGPIGVNMATYAGYTVAGVRGALVATLSLVTPSFIIIITIAKFLQNYSKNKTVQAVFYGIRPAVAALIGYAIWELLKIVMVTDDGSGVRVVNLVIWFVAIGVFQIKKLKKVHPLVWIAMGALLGILLKI